jgi:adenine-specific DNA-methyltransferase
VHYLGSKAKLLPFIRATIRDVAGENLHQKVFCDLFAGSGAVSLAYKEEVSSLILNDMEYYSYVLLRNILRTKPLNGLDEAMGILVTCKGVKGKIFSNYALGGGVGRSYFSDENAQKIDALRLAIETYASDEALYFCLLASLIESAHRVSNIASIYGAFLKQLKPLAQKALEFKPLVYEQTHIPTQVYCEDANTLIERISGDVLYLDPPYNHRQYGANYHLLNTIARYDNMLPKGKTGVRQYESSRYCKATTAFHALEELVRKAQFSTLFLSYNNEGLISQTMMADMMKKYGRYTLFSHEHPRFKAHAHHGTNPKTIEFLHVREKRG